jgi:hypothetical protein
MLYVGRNALHEIGRTRAFRFIAAIIVATIAAMITAAFQTS